MNATEERILQAGFLLELHKGAESNAAPLLTTKGFGMHGTKTKSIWACGAKPAH